MKRSPSSRSISRSTTKALPDRASPLPHSPHTHGVEGEKHSPEIDINIDEADLPAQTEDSPPHPHTHSPEAVKAVINRLSRIEGHVRAIKTMVQEDRECPQVLIQIAAVRGALDRVARMILDEHLTACVARAAHAGNIEQEIEALKSALDRFLP